eukprot:6404502-Amphidinium_carterae.1
MALPRANLSAAPSRSRCASLHLHTNTLWSPGQHTSIFHANPLAMLCLLNSTPSPWQQALLQARAAHCSRKSAIQPLVEEESCQIVTSTVSQQGTHYL